MNSKSDLAIHLKSDMFPSSDNDNKSYDKPIGTLFPTLSEVNKF